MKSRFDFSGDDDDDDDGDVDNDKEQPAKTYELPYIHSTIEGPSSKRNTPHDRDTHSLQ